MYPPKGEKRETGNDLRCYGLRIILLVLLQHTGVNLNAQRLSNAPTVIHISPEEVAEFCLKCSLLQLLFQTFPGSGS